MDSWKVFYFLHFLPFNHSHFTFRVISYHIDTGFYDIVDVDDTKRYELPESQVILLDLPESSKKLSKGDSVYAVYPDTTAFYLATVSQV